MKAPQNELDEFDAALRWAEEQLRPIVVSMASDHEAEINDYWVCHSDDDGWSVYKMAPGDPFHIFVDNDLPPYHAVAMAVGLAIEAEMRDALGIDDEINGG